MSKLTLPSESQLTTHDLSIPLNANVDRKAGNTLPGRLLRLLLLSRNSVSDSKLDATIYRIQHFAFLTGGQDLAIVFLLAASPSTSFVSAEQLATDSPHIADPDDTSGIYAYTKLQAELNNHPSIPYIPILPLAKLDGLSNLLKKHVEARTRTPPPPKSVATPFELLQLCTANPPMPQQTAFVLSDLFSSVEGLAEACTSVSSAPGSSSPSARVVAGDGVALSSQVGHGTGGDLLDDLMVWTQSTSTENGEKLKKLRDLVGEKQCVDVVDFWREEWVVE